MRRQLGAWFGRAGRWPLGRQLLGATAIVALVVAASFVTLLTSLGDLRTAESGRNRIDKITASSEEAEKEVLDMETGIRAFLITHNQRFLAPWYTGAHGFPADAAALTRLVRGGDPRDEDLGEQIAQRGNAYITEYGRPLISRVRSGRMKRSAVVTATTEGKRRVDRLRQLFATLNQVETQQIRGHIRSSDSAASTAVQRAVIGLIASMLLLGVFALGLQRGIARPIRRLRDASDRMALGDLAVRATPSRVRELNEMGASFDTMVTALAGARDRLEDRVAARTEELEDARLELLNRLALAAEFRDDDTHAHTQRVGYTAYRLAEKLDCTEDDCRTIGLAAPLHDVGKIGIPDAILLKPGKLTPDEFDAMKTHAMIGARLLSGSSSSILQTGEQIALAHHERWDGTGYPHGLRGHDIPLVARIVAVADVLDALTHARPYKAAWSTAQALAEIVAQSGRHFDPDVVDALREL
ncbi:MAG: diguanylate cyclase and serine/threonine protein kinase with repeat, partial [Solirubrobacterales bacterium]|nr:diguanylate cyclase and serine/threonine protein kinase with repeat [Solirubrobacterales bacterium]